MIVVDNDGQLELSCGERVVVAADQLYAVVVVWDVNECSPWRGALTTLDGRSVPFSQVELDDEAFRQWLSRLPGWDPSKLSHALTSRGLHLVWRGAA